MATERTIQFGKALKDTRAIMERTGLGDRVRAAILPWERGDLLLQGAVAQALEQAYEDGRAGVPLVAPTTPDDDTLAPVVRRRRRG